MDITIKDLQLNPGKSHQLDLEKLLGKKITHIGCGISFEFAFPSLQIYQIYFKDGSTLRVDGEHDIAYCYRPYTETATPWPQLAGPHLAEVYNAWNGLTPDDEEDYKDPKDYLDG